MIRVTVELIPSTDPSNVQLLGVAIIANDGTGTATVGNYFTTLSPKGSRSQVWRSANVRDFPRKRLGPWDLIYRALKAAVGERNP